MNMNTTTRLDDKLNGLLVAAALGCVFAVNVSTFNGAAMGRNGAAAQVLAKHRPAPAPVPAHAAVVVAAR
jgi:hypothetical protein